MKFQMERGMFFRQVKSGIISVFVVLFLASQSVGCATRSQTTTRTTTTDSADQADASTAGRDTTTVTEKTTSTTTPQSDGGIFGGAFHLLGEILAFPFRVIGSIFDAIF